MTLSFKDFLVEDSKEIYFSLEQMNPPCSLHENVLDSLSTKSNNNPYRVYLTQSYNSDTNPLQYKDKVKFVRKMFPKHARSVILDHKIKNVFDVATSLYNEGHTKITMVTDPKRVREFDALLNNSNGVKNNHGFYIFENINVISSGIYEEKSSDMICATENNNFMQFTKFLPEKFSNNDSKKLFNAIRTGIGLDEITSFKNHIELESISETRESYVSGDLYSEGDEVIIKDTDEVARVSYCGSNYIIIENKNGDKSRKWLDSVEKIGE